MKLSINSRRIYKDGSKTPLSYKGNEGHEVSEAAFEAATDIDSDRQPNAFSVHDVVYNLSDEEE